MNTQRRRVDYDSTSANTLNDNRVFQNNLVLDEGPSVNAHGLRFCFSIEPEVADANANGVWAVYCLPASIIDLFADMPNTEGDVNNENYLPYVWGQGCWTASNQAPYHYEFAPQTSRTCQNGARLIGSVLLHGITTGNIRCNQMLTCFTSN